MQRYSSSIGRPAAVAAGLAAALVACSDNSATNPVLPTAYAETKLVANVAALGASIVDPNLANPWGLAFSPTGVLWVSDNHSGTATLYDAAGAKLPLVVTIPPGAGATRGAPTGVVFNPTTDFVIPGSSQALFIFAGEDGTISAWNQSTGTSARLVADRSSRDAVYKGVAMAPNGGANFLYATNFKQNAVDVFDRTFKFMSSFTDSTVPAGYAPFGIHTIGGQLYVTFAKQKAPDNEDDQPGAGNGYVDVFNADGTRSKRFVSRGRLNAPWAVVTAPSSFGSAGGDILIGNFGDGLIGAYDAATGSFRGFLRDSTNASITIEGLWDLTFGVGAASTTLYFSAGPNDENDGLVGTLTAK